MGAKSARKTPASKPRKPAAAAATTKPAPPDLAQAFRQAYVPPVMAPTQVVTLDPDVAPHFRDSRAVNDALRALLRVVKQVRG